MLSNWQEENCNNITFLMKLIEAFSAKEFKKLTFDYKIKRDKEYIPLQEIED